MILLIACCRGAFAHGAFGSSDSMWAGVFHLLTAPLAIAGLLGVALAGAGVRDPWTPAAAGVAGLAATLTASAPTLFPTWLAAAAVVLIGLVAIAARSPVPWLVMALSVCGGLAAGLAADLDQIATATVIGVGGATAVLLVLALVAIDDLSKVSWLRPNLKMAKRIGGSWIAAIGLLLLALALRTP